MNPIRRFLPPLLAVLAGAVLLPEPARAQLDNTPQALNAEATNLMNEGKWQDALALLTQCVERFDGEALKLYGPQFGVTWYRKGICELKLKQWEAAMSSFETCHTKYPAQAADGGGTNVFHRQALLRWGEAAQGAGQWQQAIDLYNRYLKERDASRDKFHPGTFTIQLAICHFKAGQVAEGIAQLENALGNRTAYGTPEAGIVAAFQSLVEAVIETGDEQALLGFLDRNRAAITLEPWQMERYVPIYLKLAGEAFTRRLERSAFALYQLVPGTRVMLDDVNAQLARLGDRAGMKVGETVFARDALIDARSRLSGGLSAGDPHEVTQLAATAFLHESSGNLRGAYVCYRQLELLHPKSRQRESNLYNLVRTSSVVGDVLETERYGSAFLDTFPNSEYAPTVERLMLSSLFFGGRYEEAIKVAVAMLPTLEKGGDQHDLALHVLGGSYFYTGRYQEAQERLDEHAELYPESDFKLSADYFRASNLSRLQFWAKSAKLLDEFLSAYPDPAANVYFPFALYDRANAHYALDENEAALAKLERIESEFPGTDVAPMAFNLQGNIEQSLGDSAAAEASYQQAMEIAESRGNRVVASEALYALIGVLTEKPDEGRLAEALPLIDTFWKEYGESSPYRAQVAVAQVPALEQAGRGAEALERLQAVIAELASRPGAAGLEEVINSYTEIYLANHSAEQLKEHYYDFPGIEYDNKAARALLRIALIGVYEDQIRKAADDATRIRAEAGIKVLFRDLRDEFDLKDLSNFILVRVGDFIRETNSPREAIPYYSEVLERDDTSYQFPALFGRAAVLAQGSEAEKREAITDFQRVLADAQDRSDKDRALFRMISTQMDVGDFEQAKDNARLYLDREQGFAANKPEVALMLAEAYGQLGLAEDAIVNYLNTSTGYRGSIRISAPATKRFMELLWERGRPAADGRPSDRQYAYNFGRDYTDQTRRLTERMSEDEVAQWREVESLVRQYEADPGVKSKEELEKEAAQ